MREAGVVSLNIRMVRECYQMMDLMEKQDFVFTQEDKRILLALQRTFFLILHTFLI